MNNIVIRSLLQKSVVYHPLIAKATGSVKLTVLWGQIHYWTDKTKDPDGWVYKSNTELFDELGLTRRGIDSSRELGMKLGVLFSEVRGTPPTVHFRINEDRMIELLENYLKQNPNEKPKEVKQIKSYGSLEWVRKIPAEDLEEITKKYSINYKIVFLNQDALINYCEAHGKRYSNYKAALMNFIKGYIEKHPGVVNKEIKKEVKKEEDPREQRTPEEQEKINRRLSEIKESVVNKFQTK